MLILHHHRGSWWVRYEELQLSIPLAADLQQAIGELKRKYAEATLAVEIEEEPYRILRPR